MPEQATEKTVKIPYSLYRDLVHYFLGANYEEPYEELESRIKAALREKQEANERRLLYSAKLANERKYAK